MLEEHCAKCGYKVIFIPKYHPELNFIEQCWGYAKCIYHLFPMSSLEKYLERNMLAALEAVPLESMNHFATHSSRFADTYFHGLNSADAAWANKKYRGHQTHPPSYCEDLKQRTPRRQ
jgi:transposase